MARLDKTRIDDFASTRGQVGRSFRPGDPVRERLEALGHGVLEPTGKGVVMVPTGDQQVPQC